MYADTWWALYRMSITSSNTEEQAFFSSSIAFSKRWLVKKELQKTEIYVGNLNTVKKCWFHFGVGCLFFFFGGVCVCVGFIWVGWYFCWSCSQARNGFGWSKLEKKELKDHVVVCKWNLKKEDNRREKMTHSWPTTTTSLVINVHLMLFVHLRLPISSKPY